MSTPQEELIRYRLERVREALDDGASVQQTTDGGYILTGYSHPNDEGNTDAWLIKTGPNGE